MPILTVCNGRYRAFTIHCGAGARVLETWQEAQLEPNTLIEAEGLSANAKLELKRCDWKRLNQKRKEVNLLLLSFFFLEKKKKYHCILF